MACVCGCRLNVVYGNRFEFCGRGCVFIVKFCVCDVGSRFEGAVVENVIAYAIELVGFNGKLIGSNRNVSRFVVYGSDMEKIVFAAVEIGRDNDVFFSYKLSVGAFDSVERIYLISAHSPFGVVESKEIAAFDHSVDVRNINVFYENVVCMLDSRIIAIGKTFRAYVVEHNPAFGFCVVFAEREGDFNRTGSVETGCKINLVGGPHSVCRDGKRDFFVETGNREVCAADSYIGFRFYCKLIVRAGRNRNVGRSIRAVRLGVLGVDYEEISRCGTVFQQADVAESVLVESDLSVVYAGEDVCAGVTRFGPVVGSKVGRVRGKISVGNADVVGFRNFSTGERNHGYESDCDDAKSG